MDLLCGSAPGCGNSGEDTGQAFRRPPPVHRPDGCAVAVAAAGGGGQLKWPSRLPFCHQRARRRVEDLPGETSVRSILSAPTRKAPSTNQLLSVAATGLCVYGASLETGPTRCRKACPWRGSLQAKGKLVQSVSA